MSNEEYRLINPRPVTNAVRRALGLPLVRRMVLVYRKGGRGVKR